MRKMSSSEISQFFALMTKSDILAMEGAMYEFDYDLLSCFDKALGFNIYMHAAWGCDDDVIDWVMKRLTLQYPDYKGKYGPKINPRINEIIHEETKMGMNAVELAIVQNQPITIIEKLVNIGTPVNLKRIIPYKFQKGLSEDILNWIKILEEREKIEQSIPEVKGGQPQSKSRREFLNSVTGQKNAKTINKI